MFQNQRLGTSQFRRMVSGKEAYKGVDYANQRFNVSQYRAIDEKNYVYIDGVLQKRRGYTNVFTFESTPYHAVDFSGKIQPGERYNKTNINGMWQFKDSNDNTHVIFHVGRLLYEVFDFGLETMSAVPFQVANKSDPIDGIRYFRTYEFEDYKSEAFVGNHMLYFLGGNKFMVLWYDVRGNGHLEPVENNPKTFVPTTTISITAEGSEITGRATLDNVNLLTEWRKNKILTGTNQENDRGNERVYTLDSPIVAKNDDDISKITVVIKDRGKINE